MTALSRQRHPDVRGLLDLATDFYWRQDAEGRFVAVTGAAVDAGDIDPAEWIGLLPDEIGLIGEKPAESWPIAPGQSQAKVRDRTVRWRCADGRLRYLNISGEALGGDERGWHGLAREITEAQQRHQELSQLHAAIDGAHDMVFVLERETMRFIYVNDRACELTGYDRETLLNVPPYELLLLTREQLRAEYDEVVRLGEMTRESRTRTRDGRLSVAEERRRALCVDGRWLIVSNVHDISQRKQMEAARDRLARMYATLNATNEAILRTHSADELYQRVCAAAVQDGGVAHAAVLVVDDKTGRLVTRACAGIAREFVERLSLTTDPDQPEGNGLVGLCYRNQHPEVCHDYERDSRTAPWRENTRRSGVRSGAAVPVIRDGQVIAVLLFCANKRNTFDAEGVGLMERTAENIVFALDHLEYEAQRKAGEAHIEYLATHDALTGLPNRTLFNQALLQAVESGQRHGRQFAVMFIDLDRFKIINDSLGHEAGDKLLQVIGERLRESVRASDVVARIGGDEFVVLVNDLQGGEFVARVARDILARILEPVTLHGQAYRVTTSIGIALYPDDAEDTSSLLKHADMAMYRAKEEGKNNFQFYSPNMKIRSLERIRLENHLRQALEAERFTLAYQAKISLADEHIIGVEALLRWHDPVLGDVTPGEFLPLAEEIGLIIPIGRWVLEAACTQNMAWQRAGMPALRIAVNISPIQFADHQLVAHIESVLEKTGMPAHLLELEITETAVMHDIQRALAMLAEIKRLGVYISIDDFGTGYSSLTQLRELPVDSLKIDRSFVRDLSCNMTDQSIAKAIITMGKNLSLNVIAEGVETAEQQAFLRSESCDDMQGYYFSRPGDGRAFAELMARHQIKPAG